jgi:amino acid transporter
VLVGGFTGSAGIALAFAFASYIGFEATAIYGEESKDPKRTVPIATHWPSSCSRFSSVCPHWRS